MSAGLWDRHRELLEVRAVIPEVIRARGYSSTTGGDWLHRSAGFSHAVAALGPGLVIPVHDVHGQHRYDQFRPDQPRRLDGKPAKYELPYRARLVIDVPPAVLTKLDSPARPLWITEGPVKADAAVSAGLIAVGMFGVFGWRGRNSRGGKTVLADWEFIALNGREVYLAPDSDVRVNPEVAGAVTRLGAMLATRDADVRYVYLPHAGDSGKTGLDDWLAVHGPDVDGLLALADDEPPARPKRTSAPAAPQRPEVPVPADPAALLDELRGWLCSYVAFPSAHHAVTVTLWIVHTHIVAQFGSTPRLALLSPERECGKTRVLELAELTCAGAEILTGASPAYLFRRIGTEDAGPVTLLLDEADAIWKRGKSDESAEALRSIVDAGHRKGATVGRVEMNSHDAKLVRFPVYAPAALAAIGTLPDTIMSRSVVVHMRRRAPGEQIRPYRERITRPEGDQLCGKIAAWAAAVAARVGDPWPDLPPGVEDRAADAWEPLITVATLAGGGWPRLAREACTALVTGAREDDQSIPARLLADLRTVFGDAEALWTETILDRLHKLDEAPWGDWYGHPLNPRDLARLLGQYRTVDGKPVKARQVFLDGTNRRGYRREDLQDTWERYLPPPPSARSARSASGLISPLADLADLADPPAEGDEQPCPPTGAATAEPSAAPLRDDEDPGQPDEPDEPDEAEEEPAEEDEWPF